MKNETMKAIKLLEIRDAGTRIAAFAFKPSEFYHPHPFLVGSSGYGADNPCILFGRLDGDQCQWDPYAWRGGARTMPTAHQWIQEHWDEVKTGQVVDVRFILGETSAPCESDEHFVFPSTGIVGRNS